MLLYAAVTSAATVRVNSFAALARLVQCFHRGSSREQEHPMQQPQTENVPSEAFTTVPASPEGIVVLDDQMLNQVVGGWVEFRGPAGGW